MSESGSHIPAVSVIIPVYNVAPFIRECAESLFNQTLQDIEYIFIDDASTDNSIEILEEVIATRPDRKGQVRVVRHRDNKGISYTRGEGMALAKGEWLIHCDSDDTVEPVAYSKMLETAKNKNADIVVSAYREFNSDGWDLKFPQGEGSISCRNLLDGITGLSDSFHGSMWNKLINRKLCENNKFLNGVSYCEDVVFLIQMLINHPDIKVEIIPDCLYNYRKRKDSLITRKNKKREAELQFLIRYLEQLRDNLDPSYKDTINSKIIGLIFRLLNDTDDLKRVSKEYKAYKGDVGHSKELNKFKRLFLKHALNGNYTISRTVRSCNNLARKVIKTGPPKKEMQK